MSGAWAEVATAADTCQRWNRQATSWRTPADGGFDPRRYRVVDLAEPPARAFVTTHHYASSWPAAVARYGLLEADRLVGVAVYAVPMSAAVLTGPLPTLTPYRQSLELARLVLLDQVPANAESWMLARTFTALRRAGIHGVVTFADPLPRADRHGQPVKRGHIGVIYQAGNAAYCGRSTPRSLTVLPDGSVLPARAAQKIRGGEPGAGGVQRRLIDLGATPPTGQDPASWLAGALHQIGARAVRHRGNHRYVFRLTRGIPLGMPAGPYPKARDEVQPTPASRHQPDVDPLTVDPDPLAAGGPPDQSRHCRR